MLGHVVRVPLQKTAPEDEDFVLIHVQPNGNLPLDVTLICTDNSGVFTMSIRESAVAKMHGASAVGASLWTAVLRWLLLRERPDQSHFHIIDKLDILATIDGPKRATVTIRQNISGIIQRLGSLDFGPWTDPEPPDLYQWLGAQTSEADDLSRKMIELQDSGQAKENAMQNLQIQLDEFIKKQKEREDTMLEHFRQLLNTKKLKIRDQQRLLTGAKVDPKIATELKSARSTSPTSKGGTRRKRKGTTATNGTDDREIIIKDESGAETETGGVPTPEQSDSDEEGNSAFEATLPARGQQDNADRSAEQDQTRPPPTGLPPRRELPFDSSNSTTAKSNPDTSMKNAQVDEDDDTTDDEL